MLLYFPHRYSVSQRDAKKSSVCTLATEKVKSNFRMKSLVFVTSRFRKKLKRNQYGTIAKLFCVHFYVTYNDTAVKPNFYDFFVNNKHSSRLSLVFRYLILCLCSLL